jgi:hypothetical protein
MKSSYGSTELYGHVKCRSVLWSQLGVSSIIQLERATTERRPLYRQNLKRKFTAAVESTFETDSAGNSTGDADVDTAAKVISEREINLRSMLDINNFRE